MPSAEISYFSACMLGAIQGVTEFLPVSSSGHLALAQNLGLGGSRGSPAPLAFDIILHLSTAIVVVKYFWHDLVNLLKTDRKTIFFILIGSIPAGFVGIYFHDLILSLRTSPFVICLALLVTAGFLFLAERSANSYLEPAENTWKKSFVIGLGQAMALVPGISRSGITISGGLICGLSRYNSVRFSFFLFLPAITGSVLYELMIKKTGLAKLPVGPTILGFFTALITGYLTLKLLIFIVKKRKLYIFAIYCALISISCFLYIILYPGG